MGSVLTEGRLELVLGVRQAMMAPRQGCRLKEHGQSDNKLKYIITYHTGLRTLRTLREI